MGVACHFLCHPMRTNRHTQRRNDPKIRIADPKSTPDHLFAYSGRKFDGDLQFNQHRHFGGIKATGTFILDSGPEEGSRTNAGQRYVTRK